jgi:hypothetical protein
MSLIDPSDGRALWMDEIPSRPIPTPGVVTSGEAGNIAATKVVEKLLAGFGPTTPRAASDLQLV